MPEPDTETARVPWENAPAQTAPSPPHPSSVWETTDPVPPVPPQSPPVIESSAPGANRPSVLWAAPMPTVQAEVPGAPNLVFSDTVSRFVAYLIDGFVVLIVGAIVASIVTAVIGGEYVANGDTTFSVIFIVTFIIVSLAYSVFFWTGGRRATPGQMMFKIQVANAFDGRPLTTTQAVRRWLGLGWFLTLFGIVPSLASLVNLASLAWSIVLLITAVQSPTKQGLHDRFANSAVVRPRDASRGGLVMACLVIVLILFAMAVLSVVALILLGSQVSEILERAGSSV